jgi:hypothetical protein
MITQGLRRTMPLAGLTGVSATFLLPFHGLCQGIIVDDNATESNLESGEASEEENNVDKLSLFYNKLLVS